MQGEPLPRRIGALLGEQVQCVLATIHAGHPDLHLMAFAFAPDLKEVYLASLEHTRKVRNMQAHPIVGLLWDNRTRRIQDHIDGVALSAAGRVRRLSGPQREGAAAALLQRNPTLKALMDNPAVVIFAIDIMQYRWVQGYSTVQQYSPA